MSKAKSRAGAYIEDVLGGIAVDLGKKLVYLLIFGFGLAILSFAVQGGRIPAWLLIAVVAIFIGVSAWLYRRGGGNGRALEEDLRRHSEYLRHLQNSLDVLQRILSGAVNAKIPFYLEQALLIPAQRILEEAPIADVRLSVLRPREEDPERWTISWAAGHSMAGRLAYEERIAETLARHAYERDEAQYWPNTETQTEFRANPEASRPLRSMVSIPIRKGTERLGVFNAISSEPDAFGEAERTFLSSLAGVIAVAVGVWLSEPETDRREV